MWFLFRVFRKISSGDAAFVAVIGFVPPRTWLCEALVVRTGAQSGKSVILSGGEYGNVFRARRLTV